MTREDYQIAKELKERLSSIVNLVDFKIFSSRARGNAEKYSDMDVFIEVASLDKRLKDKILDVTWEVGFKHCIVISPLIFTKDEIEKSPIRSSSILKVIAEEGVAV